VGFQGKCGFPGKVWVAVINAYIYIIYKHLSFRPWLHSLLNSFPAMAVLSLGLLIFALLYYVQGQQTNWVGTFVDPTYGGNLTVCVSQVNGVYYGQAMISLVGYLRGTIDSSNTWTGQYFMAGTEAIRGNFTLTLNAGSTAYSGTYQQAGSNIVYSVNNANRLSSATPSDLECFKVDDDMLTMTSPWSLTSARISLVHRGDRRFLDQLLHICLHRWYD
jgi:hypothetical protein